MCRRVWSSWQRKEAQKEDHCHDLPGCFLFSEHVKRKTFPFAVAIIPGPVIKKSPRRTTVLRGSRRYPLL